MQTISNKKLQKFFSEEYVSDYELSLILEVLCDVIEKSRAYAKPGSSIFNSCKVLCVLNMLAVSLLTEDDKDIDTYLNIAEYVLNMGNLKEYSYINEKRKRK